MLYISICTSFTNSLRQHKPSFGIQIELSGFNKDVQWSLVPKRHGQLLLHLTLFNIWFEEFPFHMPNLWKKNIQMKHAKRFTNVFTHQITGII